MSELSKRQLGELERARKRSYDSGWNDGFSMGILAAMVSVAIVGFVVLVIVLAVNSL